MPEVTKGNPQSRKWIIVQNRPNEHGLTPEKAVEYMMSLNFEYWCLSEEIGEEGTPHMHMFGYSSSPKRFQTIKRIFPFAHIEKAYESCKVNRDYIAKGGKWETDSKHETKVEGSFKEFGVMPNEKSEEHPSETKVLDLIKNGTSNTEILEQFPAFIMKSKALNDLRMTYLLDMAGTSTREVDVTYMLTFGEKDVMDEIYKKHAFKNVCRITNYGSENKKTSFDTYNGQDVLVLDNFCNQINNLDLTNYIDQYPVCLPARYADRPACYHYVYIVAYQPLKMFNCEKEHLGPIEKRLLEKINHFYYVNADGEILDTFEAIQKDLYPPYFETVKGDEDNHESEEFIEQGDIPNPAEI